MEFLRKIWEKIKKFWCGLETRQKIYLVLFTIFAYVVLWAFISANIITTDFNRNSLKSGSNRQELKVSSMILTETKDGQKFWEIFGETGQYNSDHKIANLTNLVGNFYKDNNVEMSFEATHGLYNEETQEIIIYDNVFAVLKDETSLTADKLTFDIKKKTLLVEGNVKIRRKNSFIATATKATIDSDYAHFKIIGNTCSKLYN